MIVVELKIDGFFVLFWYESGVFVLGVMWGDG